MSVAADDFISSIAENEGWQESLDGSSVEAVLARLEAMLPAGSTLTDGEAHGLRDALRALPVAAAKLAAGTLDEAALIDCFLDALAGAHAR